MCEGGLGLVGRHVASPLTFFRLLESGRHPIYVFSGLVTRLRVVSFGLELRWKLWGFVGVLGLGRTRKCCRSSHNIGVVWIWFMPKLGRPVGSGLPVFQDC